MCAAVLLLSYNLSAESGEVKLAGLRGRGGQNAV
jgi:hypothetical protein